MSFSNIQSHIPKRRLTSNHQKVIDEIFEDICRIILDPNLIPFASSHVIESMNSKKDRQAIVQAIKTGQDEILRRVKCKNEINNDNPLILLITSVKEYVLQKYTNHYFPVLKLKLRLAKSLKTQNKYDENLLNTILKVHESDNNKNECCSESVSRAMTLGFIRENAIGLKTVNPEENKNREKSVLIPSDIINTTSHFIGHCL